MQGLPKKTYPCKPSHLSDPLLPKGKVLDAM
jgi:hypothetical protein